MSKISVSVIASNKAKVIHKANRYSTRGAEKIIHKMISVGTALSYRIWSFIMHCIFKLLGFLDGSAVFVIAAGNFEGALYRYVKALKLQKAADLKAPKCPTGGL